MIEIHGDRQQDGKVGERMISCLIRHGKEN